MNRSTGVSMGGGLNKNPEQSAVRPQLEHLFIDNKYFSDPWHDSEFMEVYSLHKSLQLGSYV